MIAGWIDLMRKPFTRSNDFVSLDARRFSTNPNNKNYEMITSPPSRASRVVSTDTPKEPPSAMLSPSSEHDDSISAFSPSSKTDYFGKEVQYVSPTLSFSTPRPPSAGRGSMGREWDPISTYARPSITVRPAWERDDSFAKIYE